jgi:hypothetical protein
MMYSLRIEKDVGTAILLKKNPYVISPEENGPPTSASALFIISARQAFPPMNRVGIGVGASLQAEVVTTLASARGGADGVRGCVEGQPPGLQDALLLRRGRRHQVRRSRSSLSVVAAVVASWFMCLARFAACRGSCLILLGSCFGSPLRFDCHGEQGRD